jgi:TolB-like protein
MTGPAKLTPMSRAVVLALLVWPWVRAVAQCPDGAPPPCRVARSAAVTAPPANSVAVLYFDNLSRDTADAFLADGLSEELIVRLSQVRRLEVKSRFESQRLRDRAPADPRVLGRSLRAAYLVTGSLQQAGQQVRLRVSLVRTADGANVWGEVYDRTGGNILQIQSDIAREVAGAITGQLLPAERVTLSRRPTEDPIAYQLYLRAVGAAKSTSEAGLRSALALLDQAIARDSAFAGAWAEKAFVWTWLADGYIEGRLGYRESRAAAERALLLDSTNALALALLAQTYIALDVDYSRAEPLVRRALALNPRLPDGYLLVSAASMVAGRLDASIEEARQGWEADTLSAQPAVVYLWTLLMVGRDAAYDSALTRARPAFDTAEARTFDALRLLARGDAAGALGGLTWQFYGGEFASMRTRALLALGRRDAASAMADSMVSYAAHAYFNAYGIAAVFGELGDADNAFVWLDRAVDQRTMWLTAVSQDRAFVSLHGDPRWRALMVRLEPR